MQYALVDNERCEAFKKGHGQCPTCGAPMVAKCGPRMIHHWAHHNRRQCDPWWENETLWHRTWKNLFPEDCREIVHRDEIGEIHRADIKTSTGIVVELQNSAMSDAERISREQFYKNMVWVLNGSACQKNFHILHVLPDPQSEMARDIVWFPTRHGWAQGLFWRLSENQDYIRGKTSLVEVHGIQNIQQEVYHAYRGHHQYEWIRPRSVWLDTLCPVMIDFGRGVLWRLERYDDRDLWCVRAIAKRKFVHDVMTEPLATDIASRFYKIS